MNRRAAVIGLFAGIALVAYAIFAPSSDDERIREQLDELARAAHWDGAAQEALARSARIQKLVGELFLPDSVTHVPDLPISDLDRETLVLTASDVRQLESLTLEFKNTDVRLSKDTESAEVKTDALLTIEQGGRLDRDRRRVGFTWQKRAGKWRILRVFVPEPSHEQPEARP